MNEFILIYDSEKFLFSPNRSLCDPPLLSFFTEFRDSSIKSIESRESRIGRSLDGMLLGECIRPPLSLKFWTDDRDYGFKKLMDDCLMVFSI